MSLETANRRPTSRSLDLARVRSDAAASLLYARNSDGGWAYRPAGRSRIEPTCLALLALAHAGNDVPDVDVLRRWTRQDTWLVDLAGAPLNQAFNATRWPSRLSPA